MVKRSLSVLLVGAVLAVAPSVASANSADVAATQVLARATDTLVRAAQPDIHKGLAAIKAFTKQTSAQCPAVAAGSPQNKDSEQLDHEVIGTLTVVGYRTAAIPIAAFRRAVAHLSWSNHRLTRAVRTFSTKLEKLTKLPVPNLCTDIGAWATSGFATLPTNTPLFLKHYFAVDPEAEETPLIIKLATPYGTPQDVPILHRVEKIEAELGEAEAHAVADYSRLLISLELNQ